QRFFFTDQMTAALRDASHDPVPVLDGLQQAWRTMAAAVKRRFAAGSRPASPKAPAPPTAPPAPTPAPTPLPFGRRRLLADPAPAAARRDRWAPLCVPSHDPASGGVGGPAPCALRTASSYLATDFSARLDLPAPAAGAPEAVQIAETDLLDQAAGSQWS